MLICMRRIIFEISEADNGLMIKEFLKGFGVSSALLTKLKQTENGIMLNGSFAKAIEQMKTGDVLQISIESKGHMPEPSDTQIDILYDLHSIHASEICAGVALFSAASCRTNSSSCVLAS